MSLAPDKSDLGPHNGPGTPAIGRYGVMRPLALRLGGVRHVVGSVLRACGHGFVSLLFATVVLSTSCGSFDTNLISTAVATFHERFNADDWGAIYDNADPGFRTATPREMFVRVMSSLKATAGPVQKTEQRSYTVQGQAGDNAGNYVQVTYATTFALKTATESFAWRIDNSHALLFFYDAK